MTQTHIKQQREFWVIFFERTILFFISIFSKACLLLIFRKRAIITNLYVKSLLIESYKSTRKKNTQETLPQVLWIMTSA